MLLSTIFEALKYGELKQLSIGGAEDNEGIFPKYSNEVLSHLNLGLLDLYSKFPLQEKELHLKTQMGQILYLLHSDYALSNNVDGYIVDTVEEPFLDNILRIDAAFDSMGRGLGINDEHTQYAVYLPSYNSVQLPYSNAGEDYYFIYRVKPETILIADGTTPVDVDVPIPEMLLEPLLTYIAARAHNAKGGEKGKQEGAFSMQQYEQMCKELEVRNVFNNSLTNGNRKKEINGWA